MRFVTVEVDEQLIVGIQRSDEILSLSSLGLNYKDINELIEKITDDELKNLKIRIENGEGQRIEQFKWRAPIVYPKQDILCLGQNYTAHAQESARYKKEAFALNNEAVYFAKRVNKSIGHLEEIDSHSDIVNDLDYECELAAIIRRDTYKVTKEEVRNTIFGYTIVNDISARTIQTAHKQWYFGKSLDTFCSMGPVIVTADEFEYPLEISVQTFVNGEKRQDGNTRELIYDLDHIVHELSQGMTLKSGTIIATGTPAGVGMGFVPPRFIKAGDIVECRIEGIGNLINTVK